MYMDYDFDGEDKAEDISGNSRDLTVQKNVTFKNNAVTLNGGESYAETPLKNWGQATVLLLTSPLRKQRSQVTFCLRLTASMELITSGSWKTVR